MRPLVLNYPDDPRVWGLGHEFLWGDDLLVAPVTREGATRWPVYLPAGTWYDFWTRRAPRGPGRHHASTRRSTACRSSCARGAIVPMGPVVQHTAERPLDEVTLLIYPEGASRFELYEDDGRTNAYRRGQYALTAFECDASAGGVTVRIGEPVGDRSVVPAGRRYRAPSCGWISRARGHRRRATASLPRRAARARTAARAGGRTTAASRSSVSPGAPRPRA